MGGVLFVIVMGAWLAWAIYTQIKCRQQIVINTKKDQAEVLYVIDQVFGTKMSKRVPGRGHVNIRSRVKMKAPTMSIDITPVPGHGSRVEVWMSEWTTRYGMASHAQYIWRKVRSLEKALSEPQTVTTSAASPGQAAAATATGMAPPPPTNPPTTTARPSAAPLNEAPTAGRGDTQPGGGASRWAK